DEGRGEAGMGNAERGEVIGDAREIMEFGPAVGGELPAPIQPDYEQERRLQEIHRLKKPLVDPLQRDEQRFHGAVNSRLSKKLQDRQALFRGRTTPALPNSETISAPTRRVPRQEFHCVE